MMKLIVKDGFFVTEVRLTRPVITITDKDYPTRTYTFELSKGELSFESKPEMSAFLVTMDSACEKVDIEILPKWILRMMQDG